jgi:hypothetical protein
MTPVRRVDVSFNFRSETPGTRDVDRYSPTLKEFHRILWSKALPNGEQLDLRPGGGGAYLVADVATVRHWWSSDSITNSHLHATSRVPVASALSELAQQVRDAGCRIGAYAMFPSNRVDRKPTINGARGMSPRVGDRFDLTLECIRRCYEGLDSPLAVVFGRYRSFFDLFVDFRGYVKFWLLDDWLTATGHISWLLPFDGFGVSAYPRSEAEYRRYGETTIAMIRARNARIESWSQQNLS